jgi:hypothetical protein
MVGTEWRSQPAAVSETRVVGERPSAFFLAPAQS